MDCVRYAKVARHTKNSKMTIQPLDDVKTREDFKALLG